MKTVLVLHLNTGCYVIPKASPSDAGKLLALLGSAIPVQRDFSGSGGRSKYCVREEHNDLYALQPQVSMVPERDIRLPSPAPDEATRSNRAKPVQAISSTPILRLEGGGS